MIRVAASQDGAVSTAQLKAAGYVKSTIEQRVRSGLLRRRHRGVYAYGAVEGAWLAEWAAILACGSRGLLSRATGLAPWGLVPRPEIVHITLPTGSRGHRGVLIHRGTVEPDQIRHVGGLPVTSPARTLQDVAPTMTAVELARLAEEMQVRRLITEADVAPNRPGAPKLRAALAREPALTRSEAERRLLALIRAARLPHPHTNVKVGRHEVDMLWLSERLIVEIDGFAFHSTRAAFERDRVRDAELQALGYRVLRITWRRITEEPEAVVALISGALSAARSA